MNERIGKLAVKAGAHWEHGDWNMPSAVYFSERDLEKFALLIVQECIDKIETHRIPVGNSAAGEMACEWTYDALKEIRDEIKEHFGVEL